MWVTVSIYLTVIGWAYAIGSLLALLQDRAFRQALALQRFTRKVARLREPFLLIAGYGQTGELLGPLVRRAGPPLRRHRPTARADRRARPRLVPRRRARPGRRRRQPRTTSASPGSATGLLRGRAGADRRRRGQPRGHDGGRAAAPRPAGDRPHRRRRRSRDRMQAFGTPTRGQPVRPVRRPPAAGPAGAGVLPAADLAGERARARSCRPRGRRRPHGRWVVCGYGRFGRELTADLRAEGLEVTVIEPTRRSPTTTAVVRGRLRARRDGPGRRSARRSASSPAPTTTPPTCRWSRRPAGSTRASSSPPGRTSPPAPRCSRRCDIDALLVPTEVVAHEVYAQLSTPLLWRFLQEMPARGDEWAAEVIDRLTGECGRRPAGAVEGAPHRRRRRRRCAAWLARRRRPASATCCATPRTGTARCTPCRCSVRRDGRARC